MVFMWAPTANANIYAWHDANGIMQFSNYDPPPEAEVYLKTTEITYEAQEQELQECDFQRAQDEIREREEALTETRRSRAKGF